ncbi:MAG: CheR family methyltransferase [Desulfovibrio sp.]|uniref:CheR family methyltransferase n=1 Tax=Desulfovibrio sp. 7SRBS1 TaxID=3378064 RepID=UPI003B3CB8C3
MTTPSFASLSLRQTPKISDTEFKDFQEFIYSQTGIDIPLKRKYLIENRLGKRLNELKLKSFGEYYKYLRYSANKDKELDFLFEKITTNETSFFRDQRQLDVFRDFVLADWIKQQTAANKKELNIWSAGCSSGEEPYTLSMILHEVLKMSIIGWKINITANDLSPAMIIKARRGLYSKYAFKTTPADIVKRYFTEDKGGYKIHPKVQKLCSFGLINLNDPAAAKRVPKSQIIFCRNVIIYFDDEMKKRVLKAFYDNLVPGGYLILGHSESIHKLTRAFKPIVKIGGIIYQKQ